MTKRFTKISILAVVALLLIAVATLTACNLTGMVTLTFVVDGESFEVAAPSGAEYTKPDDPAKSGYVFEGWYESEDFSGAKATLPDVAPEHNKTYYAHFVVDDSKATVTYVYNLPASAHKGDVAPETVTKGSEITIKNGADYQPNSKFRFVGWSTEETGVVAVVGSKLDGQYKAGETITLSENLTLYAQWSERIDSANNDYSVFLYYNGIGRGKGAATLVREGKDDEFGFASVDETNPLLIHLEFYLAEKEGEDIEGRLYNYSQLYFKDGMEGIYMGYSYISEDYINGILALDGYGYGTFSSYLGSQIRTDAYGYYTKTDHDDFEFQYLDVATGELLTNEDGIPWVRYFKVVSNKDITPYDDDDDEEVKYDGIYMLQGYESGSYVLYDNGEFQKYCFLDLYGYGDAVLTVYGLEGEVLDVVRGIYTGTDFYEDYMGEWYFISDDEEEEFCFILTSIVGGEEQIPVFIEFDEDNEFFYTATDGTDGTLYVDGYYAAMYEVSGVSYYGNCTIDFENDVLTLYPYQEDMDGSLTLGKKMYFVLDRANETFEVNNTGIIISNGVLTGVSDDAELSSVLVIPDGVVEIAADAFNYVKTDVSLFMVTLPASMQKIGARAFQNEYTLTRVIFLSETPIEIDWSSETCPFRWPSASIVFVVPEGCQDAYKAAWTDMPSNYSIKGSVEVTVLPEFEIEDGVLMRYNSPSDKEALDITIPDEVVEIRPYVFRGTKNLRSVDLNNVVKIGEGAFELCINLESVVMDKVEEIGESAFYYCESLAYESGKLSIKKAKIIGDFAFQGCECLKYVELEAMQSIGSVAFGECHIWEDEGPLFIRLLGSDIPVMGDKVFMGNIATRVQVNDITVARKCMLSASWTQYCRHLYIESGEEKGLYIDGDITLELNGRAIYDGSYVSVYEINGTTIKVYDYQTSLFVSGKIEDGVITIDFGDGTGEHRFVKAGDTMTIESKDGLYTLVYKPLEILPEHYQDSNYKGYTNVVFNGQELKMFVNGNIKTVQRYLDEEDGKYYDFSITMDGSSFSYKKVRAEEYIRGIACADGSELTLHYLGSLVYVYGTVKIEVTGGFMLTENYDLGATASFTSDNVFTYSRYQHYIDPETKEDFGEYDVEITVTLSADRTSFTYTYKVSEHQKPVAEE